MLLLLNIMLVRCFHLMHFAVVYLYYCVVAQCIGEGNGNPLQYSCLENPMDEEPSIGSLGVGHYWATSLSFFTFTHWRRKWQPTPGKNSSSCLENPRDGGAWWAAGYGVAQSRTGLKRLSRSSSVYEYAEVYLPLLDIFFFHLGLWFYNTTPNVFVFCLLVLPLYVFLMGVCIYMWDQNTHYVQL